MRVVTVLCHAVRPSEAMVELGPPEPPLTRQDAVEAAKTVAVLLVPSQNFSIDRRTRTVSQILNPNPS